MKSQISGIWSLLFLIGLTLQSCAEQESDTAGSLGASYEQFTMLPAAETGIDFENKVIEKPDLHLGFYDYYYNGSGLAAGDFNNDGLTDLFFCGNHANNTLYFNEGQLKFSDVTQQAGIVSKGKWSTGATLVDINEDGWLDIYVSNSGPTNNREALANQLYVNNQDGTFTEQAAAYGIADDSRTTQSAFFDMDNDGDLDLIVMNHSLRNYEGNAVKWEAKFNSLDPMVQKQDVNTLYRNEGNGKFTDITREAGLYKPGFGLGLAVSDFDENGFLDIYIANDYFMPDFFYMNNGDGTFKDKINSKNSHISFYAMGCDAADINNDGLVDLSVVDMTPADHFRNKTLMASMNVDQFTWLNEIQGYAPQYMFNTLQLNRGFGVFSEIGLLAGTSQTDWSWAALLADFDNDGFKDFLVSNGYYRDTKDNDWRLKLQDRYEAEGKSPETYYNHLLTANSQPIPNYMYQNQGDLTFRDVSKDWNVGEPSFSHGAVYADLDNDGDLDIVTNNLASKAFVLKNNDREKGNNNYIRFELKAGNTFNDCLNSKVKIFYGEEQQLVEYSFTRGYQSFVEPAAHFGLGEVTAVDRAEVHWPDGLVTIIQQPAINQTHTIDMKSVDRTEKKDPKKRPLFADITNQQKGITFRHQENEYNDFDTEVLLPHQQSRLGPCVAVADVNGDGLEDFYIGGAKGQPGALYLQPNTMIFEPSAQAAFAQDAESEDLGALFFDADQDGDQDLYVASGGGGAFREGATALQDRLYLNDGAGRFSKATGALPRIASSTAVVEAADWDKDGDLDLLVGGRTMPGMYPHHPQSYLFRNDGGKFSDVTSEIYPELERIGMITDASWTDVDGDGWEDLMVVGEWMPITYLRNQEGQLQAMPVLDDKGIRGWWYSIEPGDFDGDGDQDFIVGNIGLNNKFHPSQEKNLHVFCNDFDGNNTPDIVLSKHYKGDIVPVRGKECSTTQMPFLADKFKSYAAFASSSLEDIYGADKLAEALHLKVDNFATVYLENTGAGNFAMHQLPNAMQIAPINSIIVEDFDRDGNLDAVLAGNIFETEVETAAYDAGKGLYLKGHGDGTFSTSLYMPDSGLFAHSNVKDMALIRLGGQRPALIIGNNDSPLQMFAWIADRAVQ
jgi:hypothetical protein